MLKKALSYSEMCDFLNNNIRSAKNMYFEKGFTAKQLAEHYSLVYNTNFQKACFRTLGDKGQGLGGSRLGSGNRKDTIKNKVKQSVVTVSLSDEAYNVLKNSAGTHKQIIERALLYYSKVANLQFDN